MMVVGLLVVIPGTGRANELSTPRSVGMGGSLRAAATGASGIFLNPAGIALLRGYVVEAFYDFHIQKNGHVAHTSVVDSMASKWIAAGLYYNLNIMRPDVFERGRQKEVALKLDGHETGIVLAVPLGSRLSIGTTVKYVYYKARVEMPAEDGDGNVDVTVDKINNIGVDVGMVVRVFEGFTIGVTGMNLVPQNSIRAPMLMGMGVAYGYKTYFMAAFDVQLDFTSKEKAVTDIFGGAEVFLGGKYAIRTGVMHLGLTKATSMTMGFGYVSTKAGVDVFLVQQVDGGRETRVGFAMKLFVR